ncbi:MAG: hypothetical protein GON13_01640 [Nanoarchaeota archaeon]|nr:hypothetical protein [Nanoarchaeota archaeon]
MDRNLIILEYVKKNGPSLPVEVSKATNENVLFASAILAGLQSQRLVKTSSRKIGNSSLYYVNGQENIVRERVYPKLNDREKQLLEKIKQVGIIKENELTPAERFFAKDLKDFVERVEEKNEYFLKYFNHQNQIVNTPQIIRQTIIEPVKEQKTLTIKPVKLDKADDDFTSRVKDFFINKKIRILEKNVIRSGREANFVVEVQSDLMPQKYFVKALKKKTISEKDLGMAWFEFRNKKMPLIYISDGNLSKKAKEFLNKELGENLKFVKVKL